MKPKVRIHIDITQWHDSNRNPFVVVGTTGSETEIAELLIRFFVQTIDQKDEKGMREILIPLWYAIRATEKLCPEFFEISVAAFEKAEKAFPIVKPK